MRMYTAAPEPGRRSHKSHEDPPENAGLGCLARRGMRPGSGRTSRRQGCQPIVHQEVPVALEVGEAKAVRGSAESEQFRRGGGHHRLMVVEICRREDVRRVQREAVAHPLCDTRHSGQDGGSRVRQAFRHATQRTGRRKPRATGLRTPQPDRGRPQPAQLPAGRRLRRASLERHRKQGN